MAAQKYEQPTTPVQNAGLWKNKAYGAKLDKLNELVAAGTPLSQGQLRSYQALIDRQNKLQFAADKASNAAARKTYDEAARTAQQRAVGNYLSPTANYGWSQFQQDAGLPQNGTMANYMAPLTPEDFKSQFGYDVTQALTPATADQVMAQDPGYQFRLQQGQQALDRQAAAKGNLLSGAQLKAAQQYGQNFASGEYQNAWQRDQTQRQNALDRYYQQAGYKLTAGKNILGEYNNNLANYETQRNNYFDRLYKQGSMGQNAATNTAQMKQQNRTNMVNAAFGYGASQAQNAWNTAGAQSQAIGSGLSGMMSGLGQWAAAKTPQTQTPVQATPGTYNPAGNSDGGYGIW